MIFLSPLALSVGVPPTSVLGLRLFGIYPHCNLWLERFRFIIFADDPLVYLVHPWMCHLCPSGDVMESKASSSDNHAAVTSPGSSSGEDLH